LDSIQFKWILNPIHLFGFGLDLDWILENPIHAHPTKKYKFWQPVILKAKKRLSGGI